MTQSPPEPDDAPDGAAWDAMLRGDQPRGRTQPNGDPYALLTGPRRPSLPGGGGAAGPGAQPERQPVTDAPAQPRYESQIVQDAGPSQPPAAHPNAMEHGMSRRALREAEQRAAAASGETADGRHDAGFDAILADYGRPAAAEADARYAGASAGTGARSAVADPWAELADEPEPARPSRTDRRAAAATISDHHGDDGRRRRRGPWGCLVGLLIVVALGAGAWFFLQGPINSVIARFQPAPDFEGSGTGEVLFQIHDGDTGSDVAVNLEAEGVTASYDAFYDLLLAQTPEPEFHPGVYRLAEEMSAAAALEALVDPASKLENTVLITEGTWANDALAEASAVLQIPIEELQAATANPQALGLPAEATTVEGFLFPATYTFDPGVTAEQVVQQMVQQSLAAYDAAGVAPEDRYRVATVASLIEREGLPQDFGKVSRVIQNRLDQGMLLQFDSTVHYGLGDNSVVTTTDAERADAGNAYNTYVHPGLTPGPIGNPGAAAIAAALAPEDGPWLYFVTVNPDTGETIFTSTLEEHEAAAERFYQWLEENSTDG
ncbi:endolytic transglycosylase MltG [Agromyces sp. LHK192]|uniref:endolytic transglycosylase MltG n=1 Tax=Agromyces sp. LHK192 TaxID=2498704 RepID=UPI000FD9A7A6|nr:endolytic transglycosylase MltG [Agromyces sp. LHK192]